MFDTFHRAIIQLFQFNGISATLQPVNYFNLPLKTIEKWIVVQYFNTYVSS